MKTFNLSILVALTSSLSITGSVKAHADTRYFEPPMVSIPAGEFLMGSDRGRDNEKPVHKVSVPAFQMGKYEVTLAEFRKFVEDTGYAAPNNCNHRIGKRWFGSGEKDGSWSNNMYATNEFYPVVCVSRTDAVNYAKWLSEKSGKHYRLPTEAEWEYTVRAGSTGRFFFGDEELSSQACEFANLSDYHANNMTGKLYDAPYSSVYTIQPCNDNEVLLSVVGIYKPNPFGVYDLLGNVVERLADCYVDNYQDSPRDGSAVVKDNCDVYVARGGSWHWEAFTSSTRMPMNENFLAALEGFRLVLDTDGKHLPSQTGSQTFVNELKKAQRAAKAKHEQIDAYPQPPAGLRVVNADTDNVHLAWAPNTDSHTQSYKVLRLDTLSNETTVLATKLKKPFYVDTNPLSGNARYQVVAVNGNSESKQSNTVSTNFSQPHQVPLKIEGEAFSFAEGVTVKTAVREPEQDNMYGAIGDKEANYEIEVSQSGRYLANVRVFHSNTPQQMEFWLGDRQLSVTELTGDDGWYTIENLPLDLPAGKHILRVKGTHRRFSLNWMDIKAG